MIKCFLSHSSADKDSYVRKVASLLRSETKIFDEETFEAGMSPAEEIINGLDETSLFVIFISDHALESEWVKNELEIAKDKVDSGKLDRIYPIIIEKDITHKDSRIPKWMKEELNIQQIKQPKIAARKINSRLRELTWRNHPTLREREKIFVGRNEKINNVESRFDDFSKKPPVVFIASGLTSIGRKSFIKQSLQKANVIRDSYEFPQISLDPNDSIEDFILKINDLGFSDEIQNLNFLETLIEDKVEIAKNLIKAMVSEKERVLIEDRGSLVQFNGEIVDWFKNIVSEISNEEHLVFCISSKFRANRNIAFKEQEYYMEEIPELDKSERRGLLSRYSKFKNLDVSRDDLGFFSDLLTGYPEQIIYAVDMIDETSVFETKKNSHLIQEYATDKAKLIVDSLKENEKELHFLYFLSKFEFISFEFLFDLVPENEYYPILSSFMLSSICERLGTTSDYIRVSEVVRDYVSRSRFGMPTEFNERLNAHVKEFFASYSDDNRDVSDYIFSIQQALISGEEVPERLLIPSYFVKTIKSLYDKGGSANYKEVVRLSDRILLNEKYLHDKLVSHVYFLKCQALARLRNSDFFGVVKNINEPESSFLHGFYYRILGNQEKSIRSYMRVLERKPNDFRVKSELVLVYMQSDEHELAYDLAKQVYNRMPNNPLNANNYLSCIFHKEKSSEDRPLIEEIVSRLQSDPSDRAQEMYSSARAKILAYFDNEVDEAYKILEGTIEEFPDVTYPILTLADLAIQYKNIEKLKYAISLLDKRESKNTQTYRTYIRYKSIFMALTGEKSDAIQLVKSELYGVRREALDEFIQRLTSI
ncbi:toll/interleukin-1 receptor domain-containing protein [Oceanobacter sp. 3_MG-2023]|uniref:toll/interleukin-1 receptor domain-containing protein n=1 Tax=Oceanobacter sp. 3_MG-2023 TaxID=3062622 RepID=UPI002732ADD0|nr:toll/interleukin-1 receptor domain-containing protein [Oceanobacter sp. 3_MG-2023]MDP2506349.1 toll/interleukin-1 receptor domain-containing protein [Oceanobacter sp. 3_MG-2023]